MTFVRPGHNFFLRLALVTVVKQLWYIAYDSYIQMCSCLFHYFITTAVLHKYKMPKKNFSKPLTQDQYTTFDIFKTYMVWFRFHLQQSSGYEGTEVWTMEYFPNIQHPVVSKVHCVVWWQFLHILGHSLETKFPVVCLCNEQQLMQSANYISIKWTNCSASRFSHFLSQIYGTIWLICCVNMES